MDPMQTELRNAQLTALQNQIIPHYIVNSLDAIRMKLILDGQADSAELLRCFQSSLQTYGFEPFDTVSLSQESVFLEEYLKVQQFRLLGKLTWQILLQPQTENLQIPRFLLQPLVENTVRHGLDPSIPDPHLQIRAWLEDDDLCISVTDNGKGISDSVHTKGIGLQSVKKRLQLLYGTENALKLSPGFGRGTCALLRLPGKGKGFI